MPTVRPTHGLVRIRRRRGDRLLRELLVLAECIQTAKVTNPAAQVDEITTRHIPTANDELKAIGIHLEQATGVILDACGNIDAAACGLQSAAVEEIQAATNRIYEACTFQDITGQRINKIVATLCTIEERIAVLLTAADRPGRSLGTGIQQAGACNRSEDGRALLNGPQLPDAAPNQEDVDALFAASG